MDWPCRPLSALALAMLLVALPAGCSINKSRLATEQLVVSDAVDRAVAQIDFSPLSGKSVYFDSKYLTGAKLAGNPNVEYLTSSLRQQILAYDCRLVEKLEDAELVLEPRVGALGNDSNEVTYGIPGSAALTAAAAFASGIPVGGAMPELSLGRRNHQWGATKIGLFAYDRVTHERVWQAGAATSSSQARELWVMGVGPFQRGRVYQESKPSAALKKHLVRDDRELVRMQPLEAYSASIDFQGDRPRASAKEAEETATEPRVLPAAHAEPIPATPAAKAKVP